MFNLTTLFNPTFIYFLALQKCSKYSPFTVHGLWVDYESGGFPEYCKKLDFNVTVLDSIKLQLDQKWISCPRYHNTNEALWKHEFQKHASCEEHNISQFEYFNTTLNIYNKYQKNFEELCKGKRNCMIQIKHSEIHKTYKSKIKEIVDEIILYIY
jgi:ribonuclease I